MLEAIDLSAHPDYELVEVPVAVASEPPNPAPEGESVPKIKKKVLQLKAGKKLVDFRGIDPAAGKLAVAAAINPVLEPLRIPLAAATIRPLLRLLGRGR